MFSYILKRILLMIPMIIGASLFVFVIFELSKTDPVKRMLGERAQNEQVVQELREKYRLNDPAWQRYLRFLIIDIDPPEVAGEETPAWKFSGILTLDFGTSMKTGRNVGTEIRNRFPATLELAFFALILSLAIGLGAGIAAGLKRNTIVDYVAMGASLLAVSLPVFWLALMLAYFFGERLDLFPLDGRYSLKYSGVVPERTSLMVIDSILAGRWDVLKDLLWHLTLPAVTLAMVSSALVARMTRSSVLEVLRQDFVRTAEAKGVGRLGWMKHVLRNALIPVVTIVGLEIPALLGGAVITEFIFSWPGMGSYLIDSILFADVPAVQGVIMFMTTLFIIVNLVVDLAYAAIDPRIRLG